MAIHVKWSNFQENDPLNFDAWNLAYEFLPVPNGHVKKILTRNACYNSKLQDLYF